MFLLDAQTWLERISFPAPKPVPEIRVVFDPWVIYQGIGELLIQLAIAIVAILVFAMIVRSGSLNRPHGERLI